MKKYFIISILCLLSLSACNTQKKTAQNGGEKKDLGSNFYPTNYKLNKTKYGAGVGSKSGVLTLDELFAKLKSEPTVSAKVLGKVVAVCKMKGCWMRLQATDGREMMIKFKDYAFFMPLDLSGWVVIDGLAKKENITVEELRHYAEDDGATPEQIAKITEPKEEFTFLASGVQRVEN